MITYTTAVHTDVGIRKKINQDAIFVEEAETEYGKVLFAAICDGMGGLSEGEVASYKMTQALAGWFEGYYADYIDTVKELMGFNVFKETMTWLARQTGDEIANGSNFQSGTTLSCVLIGPEFFYTANVGDSRVYLIEDGIHQLTKDQSVVQEEIDAGLITEEQALTHPQRSVLLQCVGATEDVDPDFTMGKTPADGLFILCSDGFRHVVSAKEMEEAFSGLYEEEDIREAAVELTELNKSRKERDNISVIAIRVEK